MDFQSETGSVSVDSSLWPHYSNSLQEILTEINQNVQGMLRLIKDNEPDSAEKFLCLYQSLGQRYNDLNKELFKGLLAFDTKLSCSESSNLNNPSSVISSVSSFKSGRVTSHEMVPSFKLIDDEVEKKQSGFLLADMFCAELETARKEIEFEKGRVLDLESKLLDSSNKIEMLESELEETGEVLGVSEIEVSKLMEMLRECKAEKANLQSDNAADLLESLRAEVRSRDVQIEQMEEYLNQVCVKDTEIESDSGTDKNVTEELRARVEELEKQVEMQRDLISEREDEKREAIRQLCFSVDHYKTRYVQLVRSLSDKK